MTYALGIDLGTTYTCAAVARNGRVEVVQLGNRSAVIPSVVFLREDQAILAGEAASRRGALEPTRLAREFKRRFGDTTPILLGGAPYSADALTGRLLRWVVDQVVEREGGPPQYVGIAHPANWGPFKRELLDQAVRLADLDAPVVTITEPVAAATHYASLERIDAGALIAVYDLGGGTFDAAVVRKTATGFELLGEPEGIERLGGIDFDEAVFAHVASSLKGALDALDPSDPVAVQAVARLREECVEAKEALSSDTEVSIPVLLPNLSTEVRLTRREFEAMIRPPLTNSITALRRALRSAQVEPDQLSVVLLVGGSSRIPVVSQLVSAELGRPVALDAHPKHSVALGAAAVAAHGPAAAPLTRPATSTGASAGQAAAGPGAAALGAAGPGMAGLGGAVVAPGAGSGPAAGNGPGRDRPPSFHEPDPVRQLPAVGSDGAPTVSLRYSPPPPPPPPPPPGSGAAGGGLAPPPVTPPALGAAGAGYPAAHPGPPPGGGFAPPPGAGGVAPVGPAGGEGPPPTRPATAAGGGRRTPVAFLVAIVLAVAATVVGIVLATTSGGDDEEAAPTTTEAADETTVPTTDPSATTAPSSVPDTAPRPCDGVTATPCIDLSSISVAPDGDRLVIDWEAFNFGEGEPNVAARHADFFWNTQPVEQSGVNENVIGTWELTDAIPFTTGIDPNTPLLLSRRPADASAVCVTPADAGHAVIDPKVFDCIDLPAEALS